MCFQVELSVECSLECSCYWILLVGGSVVMQPMICSLADVMMCSVNVVKSLVTSLHSCTSFPSSCCVCVCMYVHLHMCNCVYEYAGIYV